MFDAKDAGSVEAAETLTESNETSKTTPLMREAPGGRARLAQWSSANAGSAVQRREVKPLGIVCEPVN